MSNLTKAQIKHIQSFANKIYRDEQNCFVAEGLKTCADLIKFGLIPISIYCTQPCLLPNELIIEDFEMKRISFLTTPSSVLGIFQKKIFSNININNQISILLDGIQDPGNLGTIIRTADWFGIKNIFCSIDTADAFAPKVVQATMGSIANINIVKCNLIDLINTNNKIPTYATTLNGKPLQSIEKVKEALIIIGAEGKGVSKEIINICSNQIKIIGNGNAESLNVAVATGIICNYFLG